MNQERDKGLEELASTLLLAGRAKEVVIRALASRLRICSSFLSVML